MEYFSQAGQDKWVCEFFKFAKGRFFLDIGAYDGIKISNTYALERFLEWKGLCIEANPDIFGILKSNRQSICINAAVGDRDGVCGFKKNDLYGAIKDGEETVVELKTLRTLLIEYNSPKIIDYISIDIEGNEYSALTQFPFDTHNFLLMTIEHNLYSTPIF
jgi:FkbM family methyltransferase